VEVEVKWEGDVTVNAQEVVLALEL